MVSVGQGAQKQIEQSIEGLGTNMLTVMPGSIQQGFAQGGFGSSQTLTYDDSIAVGDEIPGLAGVAPEMGSAGQVKYGRNNWRTSITGTTPDYLVVRNWQLAEGRFFTEEDNRARRNVCVIGSATAGNLFGEESPTGKRLKIMDLSFTVLGVLETRGGGGFGNQDDIILIPIETSYKRYTGQKVLRSMSVSVADKVDMNTARDQITELLRTRHKIASGAEDDFMIMSQEDIIQTMQGVTGTLTLLLASIAGISLLVGGIGIMNIMLVSVTERTREIGIRKAIGARRRDILAQFLTEAVILSGTGGLLGWTFGSLGAEVIRRIGGLPVSVSLSTVLLALGFSVAVGMFFGIYPAAKAARMDPIQALHYE
jgi:putative ABC transport system permease protein